MYQRIRFTRAGDGVRVAYATHGQGPPLVKVAHWMTHREYDWLSPVWSHWLTELGRRYSVVRYDARDTGLSDRDIEDVSLDAWVADLEAVVDDAGLGRFPLFAMSSAGPVAIAYAARHPERVSHLVCVGAYAVGRFRRGSDQDHGEAEALLTLMRAGWARDNPAVRQMWAGRFVPDAGPEQLRWFNDLQKWSATADGAVRHMAVRYDLDVTALARRVAAPSLVLHARDDGVVPFEQGRQLAALIPGAEFSPLESRNHLLLADEPAWPRLLGALDRFLGSSPAEGRPDDPLVEHLTGREAEVLRLVAAGLTNAAIGERLVVSERTVERHLSNAYVKLGLTGRPGRAAAAALIARS